MPDILLDPVGVFTQSADATVGSIFSSVASLIETVKPEGVEIREPPLDGEQGEERLHGCAQLVRLMDPQFEASRLAATRVERPDLARFPAFARALPIPFLCIPKV